MVSGFPLGLKRELGTRFQMHSVEDDIGWGRTLLLGDVGNRLDTEDLEKEVSHLKRELDSAYRLEMSQEDMIVQLFKENAQLKLDVVSFIR